MTSYLWSGPDDEWKCFARLACVPNLFPDGLPVYGVSLALKCHVDGRLGVDIEFVASELPR